MSVNYLAHLVSFKRAPTLDDIGDQRIGYVLAHALQEEGDPFWPPSAVCQVIDAFASEDIERGFANECFFKRGSYTKAINEGGQQERELAARYREWANATFNYPRTSAILMSISDEWTRQAEREDIDAEQRKMKM